MEIRRRAATSIGPVTSIVRERTVLPVRGQTRQDKTAPQSKLHRKHMIATSIVPRVRYKAQIMYTWEGSSL
jgi:hypothetical protein